MKKLIFPSTYDPDDWDEDWDEDEGSYLEYGHAYEYKYERPVVRAYNCPRCKRVLFQADVDLHGVIFIKCRKCRKTVGIETTPTVQRIGFI